MYSIELLLEMLDISVGAMNENELCSYCAFSGTQNCYPGRSDFICQSGLFEGLKIKAEKRLRNKQCA